MVAAAERHVDLPLGALPERAEIEALAARYEGELAEAVARGAGAAERRGIEYHAKWARLTARAVAEGRAAPTVGGVVHAVRHRRRRHPHGARRAVHGDRHRREARAPRAGRRCTPATPTAPAATSPSPSAYPEGGYEPAYSNRSYGLPAPVSPACERLLVERGVRLAESLFLEHEPYTGPGWSAEGPVPVLAQEPLRRPAGGEYAPPRTARHPQPTLDGSR